MRRKFDKCYICKRLTYDKFSEEDTTIFVCELCHDNFFIELYSEYAKIERLINAMQLSQEHDLTIGVALNVARGRYSLQEAKHRMRLRRREEQSKSVDVYSLGRRLHGSYK